MESIGIYNVSGSRIGILKRKTQVNYEKGRGDNVLPHIRAPKYNPAFLRTAKRAAKVTVRKIGGERMECKYDVK